MLNLARVFRKYDPFLPEMIRVSVNGDVLRAFRKYYDDPGRTCRDSLNIVREYGLCVSE